MKSENENMEAVLSEVISQYQRIYDSSDLLDQKATSFIGFISIFFSIVIGIMISGNVLSAFNPDNSWTFFVLFSMILVFLVLSLFFSFKIIFGSIMTIGPDLIKLYEKRMNQKQELADWRIKLYIDSVYKNYKRLLKRLFIWKLSVSFAFLSILGMALLLIETVLIKNKFQQIVIGCVGTVFIMSILCLIIFYSYRKYSEGTENLERLVNNWEKTKTTGGVK